MGRVILKCKDNKLISLKCKSKERAREIAKKRPNVVSYEFYDDNQRIPSPKKNQPEPYIPASFEELDAMMRKQGLIDSNFRRGLY
jgi:hypothetical protein